MGYRQLREFWTKRVAPRRNRKKKRALEPLLNVKARLVDQRRRHLQKAGALLVAAAGLAAGVWMLHLGARGIAYFFYSGNPHYMIRSIESSTDGMLKPAQIHEYAGVAEGTNLFAVEFGRMRKALLEVPVIQAVELKRRLPDQLLIRVFERIPVARLDIGAGQYQLAVDQGGVVLGPSSALPELPQLTGLRGQGLRPGSRLEHPAEHAALAAIELCRRPPLGTFIRLQRIDLSPENWLAVELAQGERVRLPYQSLAMQLEKLAVTLRDAEQNGQIIEQFDLTVMRNPPLVYRRQGERR